MRHCPGLQRCMWWWVTDHGLLRLCCLLTRLVWALVEDITRPHPPTTPLALPTCCRGRSHTRTRLRVVREMLCWGRGRLVRSGPLAGTGSSVAAAAAASPSSHLLCVCVCVCVCV